jgi:hypothetical protein
MKSKDALRLVRIISHYLNLANVADQHHIVRLMRKHQIEETPMPYTFHDVFDTLIEAGVSTDDIYRTTSLPCAVCRVCRVRRVCVVCVSCVCRVCVVCVSCVCRVCVVCRVPDTASVQRR